MLVLISISPNANIKYVIFRGRSSDQLIAEIRNQTPKLFHTITNNENKKKTRWNTNHTYIVKVSNLVRLCVVITVY